ncbi:hypothetical protein AC230_05715 [Streptomyces caatingaensis]|uniref:EfeO-type cupredoxin-like domain-containing protein n=1 Tax=Streptomyces caatingaensis TaxID=1678637 RepID=A0A0K9XNL3_9ACTN|nr:hypothetical protein AC230_05715 [Streptomyces caatingaensis]
MAAAPAAHAARAAATKVTIAGFAYSPGTLTVGRGTTVTWTNTDAAPHTVTSEGGGPLRSATLRAGDSYTFTFNSPGTYSYFCTFHPHMHGTVVVR